MSRPSQTNKWGAAAEAVERGDKISWRNDSRANDSQWLDSETKRTQQESLETSGRALRRLNEAQTMAEQNLVMLNSQSEQFNSMEKRLDVAGAHAKANEAQVGYLKSLNKMFFLPAFGGKKAQEKDQELNRKLDTDDFGNKKHIKARDKEWARRNERVKRTDEMLSRERDLPRYNSTPEGLEHDDTEAEINDNINNISSGLSRLKMMGRAMSEELESQSSQMNRIASRTEKTRTNVSKLNSGVNRILDPKKRTVEVPKK